MDTRWPLDASGTTLAVGARGEASGETGVDGNQGNNNDHSSGAVYIFTLGGELWTQQSYLKTSNTGAGDLFGTSVAFSSNGLLLAVGAESEESEAIGVDGDQQNNTLSGAGAGYLFVNDGTVWAQSAYVKASNTNTEDKFGSAVTVSDDGMTIAFGAKGEASGAGGLDGNQDDNSAPSAGAAYLFTR